MKKLKYIFICLLFLGFASCSDFLDINNNPDNPNNTIPAPDFRLRGMLTNFVDAYESSGTRAAWFTGNICKTTGNNSNDKLLRWDPAIASTTWPYQRWFVFTAANIKPLIEKAKEEEAWHYVGAAKLIHAWGFMTMLDLYGEMPYTEALSEIITPKYDNGETIFWGCLAMLDEAIVEFEKEQAVAATPFASGDIWNGGDAEKWIKLAYGLKARWLNNLSKKKAYDPNKILDALSKAAQSNADNTVMSYINPGNEGEKGLDALQHGNLGGGTSSRITKWYLDLLTNTFTGGSGVEDPRTDRLVPSAEFIESTGVTYKRTVGVDMINSDIRLKKGPILFEVHSTKKDMEGKEFSEEKDIWFSNTKDADRKGDSIYISIYSEKAMNIKDNNVKDDRYIASRYKGKTNRVMSTGTFYTRADAPGHLLCYHEICFIKAEVLFRKGDKAGALVEYKNGIRAHMELMNLKLATYDQNIIGKQLIKEEDINNFLNSAAVAQNDADLTMAKIMQQKFIACSYSLQNWNDMRRFDYSVPGDFGVVYIDYDRPKEFSSASQTHFPTSDPKDPRYWMRRFQQCGHEVNYNSENLKMSNEEALLPTINSLPVWWDTAVEPTKTEAP